MASAATRGDDQNDEEAEAEEDEDEDDDDQVEKWRPAAADLVDCTVREMRLGLGIVDDATRRPLALSDSAAAAHSKNFSRFASTSQPRRRQRRRPPLLRTCCEGVTRLFLLAPPPATDAIVSTIGGRSDRSAGARTPYCDDVTAARPCRSDAPNLAALAARSHAQTRGGTRRPTLGSPECAGCVVRSIRRADDSVDCSRSRVASERESESDDDDVCECGDEDDDGTGCVVAPATRKPVGEVRPGSGGRERGGRKTRRKNTVVDDDDGEGKNGDARRAARQMARTAGGTQYATEFRGRMLLMLVPLLLLAVLVVLLLLVC
ncbi:hypothetical protein V9T40_010776 [Parthenolecanium corni]|uniref:Uncharacterized protein n=1 Tax=Parthenolecanium corni TaxID=536013 RepID=A0AAN9T4R8_9HEMI